MITVKKLEEWDACESAIDVLKANGGKCGIRKAIRLCEENHPNWLTWLMTTPACGELIKAGVDINVRGRGGHAPLHYAAHKGLLVTCKLLLDHGADVNARTYSGITPLHHAECWGYNDIVKLLKEHGGI